MKPPFLVSIIRPNGYIHSDAFKELAETLVYGLRCRGYMAALEENRISNEIPTIVLGANLLGDEWIERLPPSTIIYNLEQIDPQSKWLKGPLLQLIQRYRTWDYSLQNIRILAEAGLGHNVHYVPVGYAPQLTRIESAAVKDIDILFYGSVNERRKVILEQLVKEGLKVVSAYGIYGANRDALIARAKIILNIHFYEASVIETVRLSYLFANRKAVVSETGNLDDVGSLSRAALYVPYDKLVTACKTLLVHEQAYIQLGQQAYTLMSQIKEESVLERIGL